MLLTKRKREDEKQENDLPPKINTSIILPIRQTASIFKQSVTIIRNQDSKGRTDITFSHGPQENQNNCRFAVRGMKLRLRSIATALQ
ncbi:hypothetical protein CEXT_63191 [Caerostris extrusa]|uniref:Methyl-CpG-binding domain-containing protein n=1 Tax=Caerostris extrusa TaxID=172846 RepID=A0AAV4XRI7_CAEEX|nr:hypothetical protein CEXT_63191 [Caerostris extrusa]